MEVASCQVAYWQYSKRLIGGKFQNRRSLVRSLPGNSQNLDVTSWQVFQNRRSLLGRSFLRIRRRYLAILEFASCQVASSWQVEYTKRLIGFWQGTKRLIGRYSFGSKQFVFQIWRSLILLVSVSKRLIGGYCFSFGCLGDIAAVSRRLIGGYCFCLQISKRPIGGRFLAIHK